MENNEESVKVELSEENKNMLFVPEGFAHGFVVLSNEAEIIYKTGSEYERIAAEYLIKNHVIVKIILK